MTLRLAAELGPGAVTTERIAERLGISQPAIFRHFPRKEVVWLAAATLLGEEMTRAWNAVQSELPAERRLRAMALAHLAYIEGTPGLLAILFSRELHIENEALRTGLAENQKRFQARLAGIVQEGIEDGRFPRHLDPSDAAFLVIAVVQSLAMRWSLSAKRFSLIAEGERLLDALIGGFCPAGEASETGSLNSVRLSETGISD
ncbi:MAG: TetR/AcrR family transcriptional regulator [Rhizobiaceae bacterium]|jgi:AcrR family transcriptional regulator